MIHWLVLTAMRLCRLAFWLGGRAKYDAAMLRVMADHNKRFGGEP